VNDLEKVNLIL